MLRGLSTVSYWTDDVTAATRWYTELLGIEPYFARPDKDNPAYVEWRVGDHQHELGMIDSRWKPTGPEAGPAGVVVYWHVDDIDAAFARLLAMGATEREAPMDRGEGFITATVVDPFGNILGIMYNPHYLEMLVTADTS